jgi:pimeloyl-ACP methyl ester carboxylesterase
MPPAFAPRPPRPASETAVLLLHGQPGSGADWGAVERELAAKFRVIAPDRPGYGTNRAKPGGFAANARAMVGLLDRLGLKRAIIVGHSWGGGAAIAMARRYPERVAGLVLVGAVGDASALGLSDRLLAQPLLGSLLAVIGFKLAGRLLQLLRLRRMFGNGDVLNDAWLEATAQAWRSSRVWRSFTVEQRALVRETPALQHSLATLGVPTVVLTGGNDHTVPPAAAAALASGIPGARLERLPGVGHLLPQQAPQAIVRAVEEVADAASVTDPPADPPEEPPVAAAD